MTPEERAERERRELIYRRHTEMQVIQLAIKDHRGCAPEWCGGSGLDPCRLFNAIEDLERRYQRTGSSLAEAFEREAGELVRQLDAPQVPDGPSYDPLSGDLIPAGQDAELEQWGRDMAAPGSAFAELVRPEIEAMGNPIRNLAIQQGIIQAEPEIHTASTVATAELSAALERQRDERPAPGSEQRGIISAEPENCDCPRDQQVYCASLNCHGGDDVLIWHPRTMKDARKGDQIRPAGSDMPNGTAVTDRYWPTTPDASDRGTWHVISAGSGKWAHKDDHVVQPGEVWLCLDGGAPRNVDPDFPIEILLTRAEIAAIELLGWDNREETQ